MYMTFEKMVTIPKFLKIILLKISTVFILSTQIFCIIYVKFPTFLEFIFEFQKIP